MPYDIQTTGQFLSPDEIADGVPDRYSRMIGADLRGQPRGRADFWTAAGRQPRDALEALTHAACRQLGAPVADEHPLAQQVSQWSWEQLILGAATVARGKSPSDIRAALSQSETGDLLGDAATTIASGVWSAYLPQFAFAKQYLVPDYRPAAVGVAKLGEFTEPQENGQIEQAEFDVDAATIQMRRYAMRIPVSLEAVAGSPSVIAELVRQPLHAGIRQMRSTLFAALSASSDLAAQTSTALSVDGFDAAADTLASIELPGGAVLDLPPAHMIVSSADYGTALVLNEALGRPVAVHGTPALSTGTWYLLPDPVLAPVIGVAVPLSGNPFELPAPTPDPDIDAMRWDARLSFGVSIVSGLGVKVTA